MTSFQERNRGLYFAVLLCAQNGAQHHQTSERQKMHRRVISDQETSDCCCSLLLPSHHIFSRQTKIWGNYATPLGQESAVGYGLHICKKRYETHIVMFISFHESDVDHFKRYTSFTCVYRCCFFKNFPPTKLL